MAKVGSKKVELRIDGIPPLRNLLSVLSGGFDSKQLMSEIGMFILTAIKLRTAEGVDVDGTTFEPYTPKYAFFRASKGHQVDDVDLFFTGSMMSAMTYLADESKVVAYFLNTEDKSGTKNPNKAAWLNEKREFFALSEDDITDILEIADDFIVKELNK